MDIKHRTVFAGIPGVVKLWVQMIDFCLKNVLAIDCSLCKGVKIHFFDNVFSVLGTQLSKKVKITSEDHMFVNLATKGQGTTIDLCSYYKKLQKKICNPFLQNVIAENVRLLTSRFF